MVVNGAAGAGMPSIVDAHHHLWDLGVRDHAWLHEDQPWADAGSLARLRRSFTLAELAPEATAAGVTRTVVVQTDAGPGETADLLALAADSDLVAGVVGWTDLTDPGVAYEIAALRALPGGARLAGIRHPLLSEPDDGWLRRPAVLRGLAAVAAAGLAYDVVCLPRHLPGALAAARAVPELTVVLDHLGNPDGPPGDGPWAVTMRGLAALPGTVCKLSGVLSDAFTPGTGEIDPLVRGYYETALQAFGPGRIMFGSDWPVCTLTSSYAGVLAAALTLTAGLSRAERAAVFAETARRAYRLDGEGR